MAAGSTYTPLATTTLSSTSSAVTFSSISGAYTDLVLVYNGYASSGTANARFLINGDTGSNYSYTTLEGSGTAAGSARGSSQSSGYLWQTSLGNQTGTIHFLNYSNTTTYKTTLSRGGNPASYLSADVNLWRSTSAITSITVQGTTYQIGSTFSLYGIQSA
jgi:hypothetical protein